MRNKSAEIEEEIEQLKHDAEHREAGAAFARQLGHVEQAAKMDRGPLASPEELARALELARFWTHSEHDRVGGFSSKLYNRHDLVFETCEHPDCSAVRKAASYIAAGEARAAALQRELDAAIDEFQAARDTSYLERAEKAEAAIVSLQAERDQARGCPHGQNCACAIASRHEAFGWFCEEREKLHALQAQLQAITQEMREKAQTLSGVERWTLIGVADRLAALGKEQP